MTIKLVLRKNEYELEGKPTKVKEALRQLNLSPEAYLVVRAGDLLNENDVLYDGDVVKLVAVISGGAGR